MDNRVAIVGRNSAKYVELLLEIWNNGDSAVLLDYHLPIKKVIEIIQDTSASKCVVEKEIYDGWGDCIPSWITFCVYSVDIAERIGINEMYFPKFKANYTDKEAVIIYSSGTTGRSKGIILSHRAINTNADSIIEYARITKDDCFYVIKSFTHSSTLTGELLVSLKTSAKLVIAHSSLSPQMIVKELEQYSATILCLNPVLLKMLADELSIRQHKLHALRSIYVSGEVIDEKNITRLREKIYKIPIYNVYGLSEAGPRVSAQTDSSNSINSVGKPIAGVSVVITNDKGFPVKKGESGIVNVDTPSRFLGYVTGHNKYKCIYLNWLNTGDIGWFDENNELYITGRCDDLIIMEAHKIYPSDVEKYILQFQDVNDCVVFGVDIEERTIIACLYVANRTISRVEFNKELIKELMPYEIPKIYVKVNEIPTNTNGKTDKNEIYKVCHNYIMESKNHLSSEKQ